MVIQTYNPNHRILTNVIAHDYRAMYNTELKERKDFHYPPFNRLIKITLRHRDFDMVNAAADYLGQQLRGSFGKRVLGPEFPHIPRIRNQYNKHFLLKMERAASAGKFKERLNELFIDFRNHKTCKPVRLVIDVDPM